MTLECMLQLVLIVLPTFVKKIVTPCTAVLFILYIWEGNIKIHSRPIM